MTPEPLPGPSHESDESLANRERQDGQLREAVRNKMFSVEDIDRLLSSRRSNGILYYRVKWKHPGSGSTWEYASSIPQVIIREFHASRTMSGKKRRRPLKGKHKFFEKTGSQSSSQETSDETQRGNGRLHPEVQNCRLHSEVQSISSCSHSEVQNCRLHSEVKNRCSCSHPEMQNCRLHSEVQSRSNRSHSEKHSQYKHSHTEMQSQDYKLHPEMQNRNGSSHPQVQNTQHNGKSHPRVSSDEMEQSKKNNSQKNNGLSASVTHTKQENKQGDINSRPSMVGVKLIRGRSFYLIQNGNNEPELQSVSMAHWYARDFITYLLELRREDDIQTKIEYMRNKHKVPEYDPLKTVMTDVIHEVRKAVDGTWEFLLTYKSLELPPQWTPYAYLSPGSMSTLIGDLKSDYYRALGKRLRY